MHTVCCHRERTKRKHARCVPVAAALELRRAVVAKVVAHFFIYVYIFMRVCACVCCDVLKRERGRRCLKRSKP
jgi:hypothetical protein